MADSSLRFVNDDITQPIWQAMGTMNGNEVISEGN